MTAQIIFIAVVFVFTYLLSCIKILKEYEKGVIFRLGRVLPETKGPGIVFVFYPLDQMERVSLRILTMDVPAQDIITKDNVTAKVNAVVYFRVMDPIAAVIKVDNYLYATSQLAQTTLRSILGESELDELLASRDKINTSLQKILDEQTDPWGIKVTSVEIKHVEIPVDMQRAMARQAQAERMRRAKVISAEGEYQASENLALASKVLEDRPVAIQMRYLQTLVEISAEKSSIVVFPIPIELLKSFLANKEEKEKEGKEKD